jgi:hypothetical protein
MTILPPLWLYDGDCGPCDQTADRIRARVQPPVELRPYQAVDLASLGVDPADVLLGPILVRSDGSYVVGPESVGEILRMSIAPYRQVGAVMLAPGIRHALRALGPRMYKQRHRFPGASAGCRVDAAADETSTPTPRASSEPL